MRLGFCSDYSEETAAFAAETGFTSLQLSAWPDSAINPDTVSEVSGFGPGGWRGRAPGRGEVDWPACISALIEVGYQGNLDIEHEEDLFDFSELVDYRPQEEMPVVPAFTRDSKGLLPGYQTLAPLVPGHLRK
ncbi:MAG: hypothetical protein OXF63_13290 [Anaerolineaceae bacterium]|nr:hypothetical protein [Anaerolineaceae bacterium]